MSGHNETDSRRHCLVYLPHSYTGSGPAESCMQMLAAFPGLGWDVSVHLIRARKALPVGVEGVEAAGGLMRHLPFCWIARAAKRHLDRQFAVALDRAPIGSVAWFWPDAPVALVRRARANRLVAVREMINSPWAHAKPVLDRAFAQAGIAPTHGITTSSIAHENEELAAYDAVFAGNAEVERALTELGISPPRILASSFGWTACRFAPPEHRDAKRPFRAAFVGTLGVRKGVPVLLQAWEAAGISGELVLAGAIEDNVRPLVEAAVSRGNGVRWLGPTANVAVLLSASDLFVFPTWEEGGPQVTYEAAAMGLPIVTTPMGAARLVNDEKTGLIVPPGDVDALANAIRHAASDAGARAIWGAAARKAADAFEYVHVGAERSGLLARLASDRRA